MSESSNILCVDDDKDFCDLITVMLRYADTDYKLTAVETPQEALDLLAHKSFDCQSEARNFRRPERLSTDEGYGDRNGQSHSRYFR